MAKSKASTKKSKTKPTKKAAPKAAKKAVKKAAPKSAAKPASKAKPAKGKATAKATKPAKASKAAAKPKAAAGGKATAKNNVVSMAQARERKAGGTKSVFTSVFTPLDDRVLIQRAGVSDRTPGGLYIPDTASVERSNKGKVVAVGRGHRDKKGRMHPLDVQLGDEVMFAQYAGSEITIDGEELLVLREAEILAIMK